jgi:hypothetical protein
MGNLSRALDELNRSLAAQHAENDARVAREYEAAQAKKAEEQKAKIAESAKYLKEALPTAANNKPKWNYWDGEGKYANITGVDGKEYMFVPDDYVKKGLVNNNEQIYNKQFLDPATFKNAVQYSLPQGMQSVMNPNGYVWPVDDYNKLGLNQQNYYKIDANNPAILGLGAPHPSMQVGSPISYITQPTMAPGLGGQQRVQQDFITAGGGRQVGYGTYGYYPNNDDFSKAFRGALNELGPLTPILFDVFAGPGTGAIYTMSKAAGEASYTGDWNKAATTIGTVLAAPYVAGAVSGVVGSALDMGTLANNIVGNAAGNAVVAGLTGGDPVAAMVNSGVGGAIGTIMGKIDGFSDLPPSVQRVFNATVRAELSGKDPSKAALLAATTAGLQAIKNGMDANSKFQSNYGRDATPEELNSFAYVQNEDELNNSFDKYMADTTAKSQAEAQAKIDEANQAKLTAFQKAQDDDAAAAAAQVEAERKAREAAEAERIANDEAERLRQAGLKEQSDREAAQAAAQAETDRLAKEKSDSEESARQAAIAEQNRLDAAEAERKANDEAERLRQAGLQENPPSIDDGTAMGDTTKQLPGTDAYKYDPAKKTYSLISDDGSEITLDENGDVISATEATDTSWGDLTDTTTGSMNLPKLPSGVVPAVTKAAVRKAVTPVVRPVTATGTGNTAITTGSSTVVPAGGGTAVQTGGGLNMAALMAIMSGLGGDQQAQQSQQPQIETFDPGKGFEYFDWESDPFAPKTKDKTNPTAQPKMAGGGSIDELLEILRRSGI